ncbi:hypothetical protein [Ruminococcus callidus]|jgi:hypothetical protein|uniref:hypothetical protein n=1 Tax=Ruminococcus callidus TaxID=40519 RepID=UPI003FD8683A
MEFFKNIVDYFDKHPGYELLMSFAALVFSIIPYVFRFFAKRFRLKITPFAYKYFLFNHGCDKNLAIQIAITNLSETPCTITQAFFIFGEREKYISAASENLFSIETNHKTTGEYYSLSLPQHLPPHQGISGCFLVPDCYIKIDDLKNTKCKIKIVCGNKTKVVGIDFNKLHMPLYL